jgi:hypothetical protein
MTPKAKHSGPRCLPPADFAAAFAFCLLLLPGTMGSTPQTVPDLSWLVPGDSGHGAERDFLLEAAFHEKDGRLEITDTTLRLENGTFSMDRARYRALLATELSGPAPIEYRHQNLRLAFIPTALRWSGSGEKKFVRRRAYPVGGRLISNGAELEGADRPDMAGRGVIYENAYGEGLHLGVLTKSLAFRKIVRFDRLESLGTVPEDAEVLEVEFELQTEEGTTFQAAFGGEEPHIWSQVEPVVTRGEPVELRKGDTVSFMRPAHAWDSAGDGIPLTLELRREGGRLFLTKLVPVEWLRRAVFPVFADVDLTFGIESLYNPADTGLMSVTALDSTRVVIAYEDIGNGSVGTALVATISGKTVSYGPEWMFNPAITELRRLSATALDSSHVVIAYRDMGNSSFGTAIVGTVSGTTITFGPEAVFNPGDTFSLAATTLDSTHVAIAYQDAGNGNFGTAIVGTVSLGDNLTFGAEYVFEAAVIQYPSVAALDSTHFVAAYRDRGNSDFGTAIVGTVSLGDVITYGPPAIFNAASSSAMTPTRLDSTRVLIAYGDVGNSSFGTAIVGTVSGGDNLSFGSEVVYNPSSFNGYNVATTLDSNHVVVAFSGSFAASNGAAVILTISGGNNICYGSLFDYDTGSISNISARALGPTQVVIAYRDGSTFGTVIVGETSTFQRLIGFETANGSDEMVSLSLDSGFETAGVRPGSGDWFLLQAVGPSTLVQGLATCEGEIGVRFSFRKPTNPATDQILLQFVNGATNLWSLRLRTDGRLQVQQDEALGLASTAGTTALADNTWYTVRLVYDAAAGGLLRVWLNESLEVNVTHTLAGTTVDEIRVSGLASLNQYYYDDFAITDSSASPPKFGQIVRREPVAEGSLIQFGTPSPSSVHYENVDEYGPITTDFNQHEPSTPATDLYSLRDSPVGVIKINGVKAMWQMSRGNGSSAGGTHDYVWRENGINRSVEFAGLPNSWTRKAVVWETPPNSGGTWTSTKLDALELGASHNGIQAQDTFISWTAAMVDYDDGTTTAVTLISFIASGYDREVLVEWQTASELNNLGFHLYRAASEEGPYERITASPIPGLGSSLEGAKYAYRDSGLINGVTYYYKLENIETTGATELHGPVSATPTTEVVVEGGTEGEGEGRGEEDLGELTSRIIYGNPSANELLVRRLGRLWLELELITEGFYAIPQEDGSVWLEIPGFEDFGGPDLPDVPVYRTWQDAMAGRHVTLASVNADGLAEFTSLRPSSSELVAVASEDGTVQTSRRKKKRRQPRHLYYPESWAELLSVGFQGTAKKALVEMAPLRWDATSERLVLARRLVVRISFRGIDRAEPRLGRSHREVESHASRKVLARLAVTERGLYAVRFESVFGGEKKAIPTSELRLSRQGKLVAFFVTPDPKRFQRKSKLYFLSEGVSLNRYGEEAVYELESSEEGVRMGAVEGRLLGEPTSFYWKTVKREENLLYQPTFGEEEDIWQWDWVFGPMRKSYRFEVRNLSPVPESSKLRVWLHGASDFPEEPDHHVRVYVNGALLRESWWDGETPRFLEAELGAGLLREGENTLEVEEVGDTKARYSMVMVNRFEVSYPAELIAEDGELKGSFSESGTVWVSGLDGGSFVFDTTGEQPQRLTGVSWVEGGVSYRAESGHSYLAVSSSWVKSPEVRPARTSNLKKTWNRAEYLILGPREFLVAAEPLLAHRRGEGLIAGAIATEDIFDEFGYGEATPESVKDFLSYVYHHWSEPTLRYVVLLGDGTYDTKNYLGTGVKSRVPVKSLKTQFMWTASDPWMGAINGDDILPDVAVGRLPAASVEEAERLVTKILEYESGAGDPGAPVVLITDNPDQAGDFDSDAEEIASTILSGEDIEKIYLSERGVTGTRSAVINAFDQGASIMSYLGHGAIHLWANENLLNIWQVPTLAPQPQQPILLTMNCLNGYFYFPYFNSLSEELLKAEGKGVIAAFSPSGLSLNDPAHRFHKALLERLVHQGHPRLGDAVLAGQAAYAQTGAFPELLSIYHVLGDPALRLR